MTLTGRVTSSKVQEVSIVTFASYSSRRPPETSKGRDGTRSLKVRGEDRGAEAVRHLAR